MKSVLEQLAEFQRFPDVHEKYIMLHRWLDKESKKAIIINKKERQKEGDPHYPSLASEATQNKSSQFSDLPYTFSAFLLLDFLWSLSNLYHFYGGGTRLPWLRPCRPTC